MASAKFCLDGRNNLCAQSPGMALGIDQDGGMVEPFRVPSHKLLPLPDGLPIENASLIEPASVSWHGVRLGGTSPRTAGRRGGSRIDRPARRRRGPSPRSR